MRLLLLLLLGCTSCRHMLLWCPKLTLFTLVWGSLRTRELPLLAVRAHTTLILLRMLHTLHHHLLLLLGGHSCSIARIRSSPSSHHIIGNELSLCIELTL